MANKNEKKFISKFDDFHQKKKNIVIQYSFYFDFPHFDEIFNQKKTSERQVDIIILFVLRKVVCLFLFCHIEISQTTMPLSLLISFENFNE